VSALTCMRVQCTLIGCCYKLTSSGRNNRREQSLLVQQPSRGGKLLWPSVVLLLSGRCSSQQKDEHRYYECEFCVLEVACLGHLVSAEGIRPVMDKVAAILELQPPGDVKGMQKFLGMMEQYRKYIPGYARLAAPLTVATWTLHSLQPTRPESTARCSFGLMSTLCPSGRYAPSTSCYATFAYVAPTPPCDRVTAASAGIGSPQGIAAVHFRTYTEFDFNSERTF
jgi:hypothetical protein